MPKKQKLGKIIAKIHRLIAINSQTEYDAAFAKQITKYLKLLHQADIADLLESLPLQERFLLWQLLTSQQAAAVLLEVSPTLRQSLLDALTPQLTVAISKHLNSDQLADITPHLTPQIAAQIVTNLDENSRQQFESASKFTAHQVGAVMDFEMLKVRDDVSCKVVLRYLQQFDSLPPKTDQIFIVADDDTLVGVLPLRILLVNKEKTAVKDIMLTDIHSFTCRENVEDVASAFERYDLVTAAVVDEQQRLIGRLTVGAMVDVMRSASEEDAFIMAGFSGVQEIFSPVLQSFKMRWLWLVINLGTAFFASRIIALFEDSISKIVALAALMPIVAGIGGNAGNQTITMIVRAMAQHDFTWKQIRSLWRNELLIALLNGLIWGGLLGIITWQIYSFVALGIVMAVAMTLNLLLAATMSVLIPYFMQKTQRDPALGSSVLITACTDSGGFFIFLGLANILLL